MSLGSVSKICQLFYFRVVENQTLLLFIIIITIRFEKGSNWRVVRMVGGITKLPESCDLYGNITE